MTELDSRTTAALERFAPRFDDVAGDWARVVRDARRPKRNGQRRLAFIPIAAAIGVVALAAWPDGGIPPSRVLDRARAASGAGEVFHVVFESNSPGTLVDLSSGERRALRAKRELWFHPERGLQTVLRVEGEPARASVQTVTEVGGVARRLYEAFARNYRDALASGLAKVVGEGELEGRAVHWVEIYSEPVPARPDLSSSRRRALADVVAIDAETYKPVYVQRTRDGKAIGAGMRILHAAGVPEDAVPVPPSSLSLEGLGYGEALRRDLSLEEARRRLKTPALWVGATLQGLALGRIVELDFEEGRGAVENWNVTHGLALAYGQMTPSEHPDRRSPYVWVRQSPRRIASMTVFIPAEGQALLAGRGAFLVRDGTHVSIEASSEELALAAARALRPIGR